MFFDEKANGKFGCGFVVGFACRALVARLFFKMVVWNIYTDGIVGFFVEELGFKNERRWI